MGNLLLKLPQPGKGVPLGKIYSSVLGDHSRVEPCHTCSKKLTKKQSRSQIASFPLLLLLWKTSCTQVMHFMAGHEGIVALKKEDRAGNGVWARLWMTQLHSWVPQLRTKEVVLIDIRQRSSFGPKGRLTHILSILPTIGFEKEAMNKAQDWGLWNISGNKLSSRGSFPLQREQTLRKIRKASQIFKLTLLLQKRWRFEAG